MYNEVSVLMLIMEYGLMPICIYQRFNLYDYPSFVKFHLPTFKGVKFYKGNIALCFR